MEEENFIFLPLEEGSEEISKALSNENCKKILKLLGKKRMSISELSKKLKLPISTVQYSIDLLKKAKLIKKSAFRYSEKGKKVIYYEPARKIIVLAPEREKEKLLEKFGSLLLSIFFTIASVLLFNYGTAPISVSASKAAVSQSISPIPESTLSAPSYYGAQQNFPLFLSGLFAGLAVAFLLYFVFRYLNGKRADLPKNLGNLFWLYFALSLIFYYFSVFILSFAADQFIVWSSHRVYIGHISLAFFSLICGLFLFGFLYLVNYLVRENAFEFSREKVLLALLFGVLAIHFGVTAHVGYNFNLPWFAVSFEAGDNLFTPSVFFVVSLSVLYWYFLSSTLVFSANKLWNLYSEFKDFLKSKKKKVGRGR